jgi:hypothetical protein
MSKTMRKRDRRAKPPRRRQLEARRSEKLSRTITRASLLSVDVAERERKPPRVEMWKAYPPHDETN